MADAIIYKSQQIKSVEFRSMRVLLALLHTALRELRFLRAALACSHSRPRRRSEQAAPSHAMLSLRAAAAPCEAAPLLPGRPSRRHRGTTPVGRCGHRSLLRDCWSTAVPCSEPLPPPLLARPRRCSPCMPPRSSQRGATSHARLSPRSTRLMARARVVFRPAAATRSTTTSAPRGTPQARVRPRPLPPPVRAPPMREVSHLPLARSARSRLVLAERRSWTGGGRVGSMGGNRIGLGWVLGWLGVDSYSTPRV